MRGDRDPHSWGWSLAREATHRPEPPDQPASRTWCRAAILASSLAAAVSQSRCAGAARAARCQSLVAGLRPRVWNRAAAAGARAAPPTPRRAPALLAPRLPRRGCQPRAPRPALALPAPPAQGAHWAEGPGCLRSPLPRARPRPCALLPNLPHMHLLRLNRLLGSA